MKKTDYTNLQYKNAVQGYLEQSEIKLKPLYQINLQESLENLVNNRRQEKNGGILERLITDKTKNLKSTVKALLYEVNLREKLNSHLRNNIDNDICERQTQLLNLQPHYNSYFPGSVEDIKKRKLKLENNVLELEKEKRKESLECWRDLMFLNKYFHSALKEYWDLVKRREALEG